MSQQLQTNKPVSKLYLIYYYFKDFKKVFIGLSIAIIFDYQQLLQQLFYYKKRLINMLLLMVLLIQ